LLSENSGNHFMGVLRISVALCTYNGSRHLGEQLESICGQSRSPDEVVICDDNSTDNTIHVLEEFASRAAFSVRVVSNSTRLGTTTNFEKAIHRCDGDVIVLADQDDIWKEEKLKTLETAFLADPGLTYIFSDGDVIDDKGRPMGCSMWESLGFSAAALCGDFNKNQVPFLLKQNVATGAAMAFRSSLATLVQPIPPAWLHDHWVALLGSVFGRGMGLSDRLIMYRQHPAQQKGVRSSTLAEKYRQSLATDNMVLDGKIERLKELVERISRVELSVHSRGQNIELIGDKISHLAARSVARSTAGFPKVGVVMSEAFAGRYNRFSESWVSIARDLLA
jgi:glycosyltransferase involved in cell wall biosynthesis